MAGMQTYVYWVHFYSSMMWTEISGVEQ